MMQNQKHLFRLPAGIHYLNCGYMSPLLKSVEEKGIEGIRRKRDPASIHPADFFTEVEELRKKFAALVNCAPIQVATMPSVSYGMNSVISNIPCSKGKHALTISEEFPSGYYSAERWCRKYGAELKVVARMNDLPGRGRDWNERIHSAINRDTAFMVISSVHWMNGTKFDLESIGKRCREVGAKMIVDGSQSVGALPMDVERFKIDALICASYKWLMGPYSAAVAYIHKDFNEGIPLEESWMARINSERFDRLTDYTGNYKPGANRYDVGESSNFILVPMLSAALDQLLSWGIQNIQDYCRELSANLVGSFLDWGSYIEEDSHRAHHLLGLQLPAMSNGELLVHELRKRKIYVSLRGANIRISVNVFNTEEDITELIDALKKT